MARRRSKQSPKTFHFWELQVYLLVSDQFLGAVAQVAMVFAASPDYLGVQWLLLSLL